MSRQQRNQAPHASDPSSHARDPLSSYAGWAHRQQTTTGRAIAVFGPAAVLAAALLAIGGAVTSGSNNGGVQPDALSFAAVASPTVVVEATATSQLPAQVATTAPAAVAPVATATARPVAPASTAATPVAPPPTAAAQIAAFTAPLPSSTPVSSSSAAQPVAAAAATATRTSTPVPPPPPPAPTVAPAAANTSCSPYYPDFCIRVSPDVNCGDLPGRRNFTVRAPDPHRLDSDGDGLGCENN